MYYLYDGKFGSFNEIKKILDNTINALMGNRENISNYNTLKKYQTFNESIKSNTSLQSDIEHTRDIRKFNISIHTSNVDRASALKLINRGVNSLTKIIPQVSLEKCLIDEIVIFEKSKSLSYSDFQTPGVIYLNETLINNGCFIEEYIYHELLHQKFFLILNCISLNGIFISAKGKVTYYCPSWHKDKKIKWSIQKMLGAAHVYIHLFYLYSKISDNDEYKEIMNSCYHRYYELMIAIDSSNLSGEGQRFYKWLSLSMPNVSQINIVYEKQHSIPECYDYLVETMLADT